MALLWNLFGRSQEEEKAAKVIKQPSPKILRRIRDPITEKIMVNPTMILSSMMIYEDVTINKWIQSGRSFDPLTGIPVQVGGWPLLLESRQDIKEKINTFLERYPKYQSEVFNINDKTIEWNSLFEKCEAKIKQKYIKTIQEQSALRSKGKQIFKKKIFEQTEDEKVNEQNKKELRIEYNEEIILQPEIPIVCFMGPSRNGKSTLVNDILGVVDACATSSKSNVALTKGAWITIYSLKSDQQISNLTGDAEEEEMKQPEGIKNASDEQSLFYLMDMEGLTHDVTTFTKRLFYACYATTNVVIWNDKNVAGDEFKKLMNELKEEMKSVAASSQKPSFIYLKRDAGDYDYEPYDTFDEYINKDDSFAWFRKMNIFSSISAYELDRPIRDKNDKKGGLNFHTKPENQQLLPPLITKILALAKTSQRFASNQFMLKQQIKHINGATALSMTKKLIADNKTLSLFLIAPKDEYRTRRRDMIFVACRFEWDHGKIEKLFNEQMNILKESQNFSDKIDQTIIENLTATKNEIYERVKNKTEYKKYGQSAGLSLGAGLGAAAGIGALVMGATSGALILAVAGWGAIGFLGGYSGGKTVEFAEKIVVENFMNGDYIKYSLGKTEEEIKQDQEKAKTKSQIDLQYTEDEELEELFSCLP